MNEKNLICYWFEEISSGKRHQFQRELFGSKEKTHGGRYSTNIRGYLSNEYFERPVRSTILIMKKDTEKVKEIIKKYGGNFRVFSIVEEI